MRGRRGVLGRMGQIRVTPRWEDDPMHQQGGHWWRVDTGQDWDVPPLESHRTAGVGGGKG